MDGRTRRGVNVTTVDLINEERRRYLLSGRTRRDWVRYIVAVESIRRPTGPSTGVRRGVGPRPTALVTAA
jgi:hypothetical protein